MDKGYNQTETWSLSPGLSITGVLADIKKKQDYNLEEFSIANFALDAWEALIIFVQ